MTQTADRVSTSDGETRDERLLRKISALVEDLSASGPKRQAAEKRAWELEARILRKAREATENGKRFDLRELRDVKEGIWVTHTGEVRYVADMSDWHVKNTIRLMREWKRGDDISPAQKRDLNHWIKYLRSIDKERNAYYKQHGTAQIT